MVHNKQLRLAFISRTQLDTMHKYSPEDLLLYLYGESTPGEKAQIGLALEEDWTLREKIAVLKTSMERLNSITVSPRTETVLNILRYASESQKITSK